MQAFLLMIFVSLFRRKTFILLVVEEADLYIMQMKLFLNLTSKDQYTHRDWDHGIKPLPYFLLHLKITVTAGAWRGTRRFYVYCIVLMIIGTTCNVQRTLGKKCKSGVLEEKFKSDYGYFQHRDGRCLLMGCTNHT